MSIPKPSEPASNFPPIEWIHYVDPANLPSHGADEALFLMHKEANRLIQGRASIPHLLPIGGNSESTLDGVILSIKIRWN